MIVDSQELIVTAEGPIPTPRHARRADPAGRSIAAASLDRPAHRSTDASGSRLLVVTALALPVLVLAVVPALQFDHWQWLSLSLAAPVAVWGAAPFHREAWAGLRRGRTTTSSLVSLGVLAGFGWSLLALFVGKASALGMRQPMEFDLWGTGRDDDLYLAVAAGLAWLGLWGSWLQARVRTDAQRAWPGRPAAHLSLVASREPSSGPADRAASALTTIALVAAAATLGFWLAASGRAAGASAAMAAVLVVGCPGGLALASPMVLALGARRQPDVGLGTEDPGVLATTRSVDTILVRSSGTLTNGDLTVVEVVTTEDTSPEQALGLVGSLARRSGHPAARAIAEEARRRCLPLATVEVLADRPGLGVRGVVDGHSVAAGRERFLAGGAGGLPPVLARAKAAADASGHIAVLAGWDGALRAVLVLGDQPRPTAAEAIEHLTGLGVRPVLLTERDRAAATTLAAAVGIDEVVADALPEQRSDVAARLQAEGHVVAVLGDPLGDLPDAPTDLVVAGPDGGPAAASRLDHERGDLWIAVDSIRFSRATHRVVSQNLWLALAANVALMPVAAAGRLVPTVAVAAMAVSALMVVANSVRILRFRSLRPPAHRRGRHDHRATPGSHLEEADVA